jgi:glycosyltransferase involved in cell wall biosynthesis
MRFRFVGSGPLSKAMLARIRQDSVARDRLEWLGQVERPRMLQVFDESHILLMTSWREANSYVVFEALSRGVPVVSPPFSGPGYQAALHGCVVPMLGKGRDVNAFVEAIEHVLNNMEYYCYKASTFMAFNEDRSLKLATEWLKNNQTEGDIK